MNKLLTYTIVIGLFITTIFIGCKKNDGPKVDTYQINIDSISSPDTIDAAQNLIIGFYGKIGSNGCYSFYKFDVMYDTSNISISCWGQYTHYEACPENLPVLYGKELIIYNLPKGNTTLTVVNPDTEDIIKTIFVK